MERVECPGCGALVEPTTRSLDNTGSRTERIIPGHNPLPRNSKGVSPMMRCPGSGQTVKSNKKAAAV